MLDGIKAIPVFARVCIVTVCLLIICTALLWLNADRELSHEPAAVATPGSTATVSKSLLTAGTLSTFYPALKQLKDEVMEVRLKDDWNGLSYTSPREAHFSLLRSSKGFDGEVVFRVGGRTTKLYEISRKLTVPLGEAQKFLDMIAEMPVKVGKYKPTVTHTDDYPLRMIEVETKIGTLDIYSTSQTKDNVPWGIIYDFAYFVVDSDAPARAFDILKPYLQLDAQKEIMQKADKGEPPVKP